MQHVLSDGLWGELRRRAKRAKRKRAAIAYFTENHLSLSNGDLLVVDASDQVVSRQATSAALLLKLHKAGVSIFSLPGLHAKVALLDGVSVIGSANSSAHSEAYLIEAAVVSDDPMLAARVHQLICHWADAGRPLLESELSRLVALPKETVDWKPATTRKQRAKGVDQTQRAWVVTVAEMADEAHPEEEDEAKKGEKRAKTSKLSGGREMSWIRFGSRRSRFAKEARPGDLVIQIWKPLGSKRMRVLPPATLIFIQKENTCVRMFVEEAPFGLKELPFGAFQKVAKEAGLARPITRNSRRLIDEDGARKVWKAWRTSQRKK